MRKRHQQQVVVGLHIQVKGAVDCCKCKVENLKAVNDKMGVKEVVVFRKAMAVRAGEVIHNELGVTVGVEVHNGLAEEEVAETELVEVAANCRQLGVVVMEKVVASREQVVAAVLVPHMVAGEVVLYMEVAAGEVVLHMEVVAVVNLEVEEVNTKVVVVMDSNDWVVAAVEANGVVVEVNGVAVVEVNGVAAAVNYSGKDLAEAVVENAMGVAVNLVEVGVEIERSRLVVEVMVEVANKQVGEEMVEVVMAGEVTVVVEVANKQAGEEMAVVAMAEVEMEVVENKQVGEETVVVVTVGEAMVGVEEVNKLVREAIIVVGEVTKPAAEVKAEVVVAEQEQKEYI
ncbi:hypothetical protein MRB53_011998 [Persea americana]|uniref:Uncharacterized protein n=1 Tax=Persea americana TaxID=3435 RepID=A0ACC2LXC8_PERAE|nr:hypothetical protein MRB53_011998 [Persea americana]